MKNIKIKGYIINTKWLFLYFLLILLGYFLVNNYYFFSNYIRNYKCFFYVDKLKLSLNVDFISGSDLLNNKCLSNLNRLDKFNLLILSKNFGEAERLLGSLNIFDYKDFFNMGNLYLIEGYFNLLFDTGDYIKKLQTSIGYYNSSLETIPLYKSKVNIVLNYSLAQKLLDFSYVFFCDNIFVKLLNINNKILFLFEDTLKILKEQISILNKWADYKDLKSCIDSFKADASKNIYLIYDNKDFYKNVKIGLIYLIKTYINNEILCYEEKDLLKKKYEESLISSLDYFKKFFKLQSDLLIVFKKADYSQMKLICENKSKISNKFSNLNKQMEKNYESLRDLTTKNYPQRKGGEKSGGKEEIKNNKKPSKQEKKFDKYTKDLIKKLENTNKEYILKIIKLKSSEYFDSYKYINDLFKKFYGNDKFYKYKKVQTIGK